MASGGQRSSGLRSPPGGRPRGPLGMRRAKSRSRFGRTSDGGASVVVAPTMRTGPCDPCRYIRTPPCSLETKPRRMGRKSSKRDQPLLVSSGSYASRSTAGTSGASRTTSNDHGRPWRQRTRLPISVAPDGSGNPGVRPAGRRSTNSSVAQGGEAAGRACVPAAALLCPRPCGDPQHWWLFAPTLTVPSGRPGQRTPTSTARL